jgi:hypothetical protein
MNSLWIKVAIGGVVVLGLVILVISLLPSGQQPESESGSKTVYEQWDKDEAKLRAAPEPVVEEPAPANEPAPTKPVAPPEPIPMPQFEELPMEQQVQAEKLFEMALFHSKQARLPGMTYKKMVDYCREIIQRWPESEYAFKAKRMLRHMPERHRETYDIAEEEIDLGGLK